MKRSSLFLFIFIIFNSFAHAGSLWLDASCKVFCNASKNSYPTQGGMRTSERYFTLYLELEAMSREVIDRQTAPGLMKEFCQKNAGTKNADERVTFEKIDCLYFKH